MSTTTTATDTTLPPGTVNPSCGHCRFWEPIRNCEGTCRRRAPQLVSQLFMQRLDPEAEEYRPDESAVWPHTSQNDWCGEFEQEPGP